MLSWRKLGLSFDFGRLVGGVDRLVSGRLSLVGLGNLASTGRRGSGFASLVVLVFAVDAELVESTGDAVPELGLVASLLSSTGFGGRSGITGLLSTTGGVGSSGLLSAASLTGLLLTGTRSDQLFGFLNVALVGLS